MAFPTNPVLDQAYSLNGVTWYYDGDNLGWYRSYVGADGQRIKSYVPLTVFAGLARIQALEDELELLQSKSFLELE